MKKLNKSQISKLSFPDFEIEEMLFLPHKKELHIYVEGAWLEMGEGVRLGRGVLFFNNWEYLTINKFDTYKNIWSPIEIEAFEPLKDLCEVKFNNCIVLLSGFGKETGQWLEWKISNPQVSAAFE